MILSPRNVARSHFSKWNFQIENSRVTFFFFKFVVELERTIWDNGGWYLIVSMADLIKIWKYNEKWKLKYVSKLNVNNMLIYKKMNIKKN